MGPGAQVVSPAGYTMGGGHSPLSPALGLAVDNVLEIQVLSRDRTGTCSLSKAALLKRLSRQTFYLPLDTLKKFTLGSVLVLYVQCR